MTSLSLLISVLWMISVTSFAMSEDLIVQNPSFEDHILTPGETTLNGEGLDPWTTSPGESVGVWDLSDLTDFPDGAPEGNNVSYSGGPAISQILSDTVTEGLTYTLSVKVGKSPCCAFPGYGVQLRANGVVLAEDANYN